MEAIEVVTSEAAWDGIVIVPIGDVQLGARGCAEKRLVEHVERYAGRPNTYFVGMGDYVDVASPSNRETLRSVRLYDSVRDALERQAEESVAQFYSLVKGTEGQWLGVLHGHHLYDFRSGGTTDTRIAELLKAPYLGTCAFIRLVFKRPDSNTTAILTIWLHHGQGSGSKASSPLNKLEGLASRFDADIYLIGHQHKRVAAKYDQLQVNSAKPPQLVHRQKLIACTGSWLTGYTQGESSYVEKALLNPTDLGGIVVGVRPKRVLHGKHETVEFEINAAV